MELGFPKRKTITDRGYSIDYGGDYRYRYDLCPVARTVVVTDTVDDVGDFTPLSIASTARVTTINLTAGAIYHSIVYRSAGKQVWVFGTTQVIVIDANPNSGNFNTIINTISTTAFSAPNHAPCYSPTEDLFKFFGVNILNPVNNTILTNQSGDSRYQASFGAVNAYYPSFNGVPLGNVNGAQVSTIVDIYNNIKILLDPFGISCRLTPFIFNEKIYSGAGVFITRNSINRDTKMALSEAGINVASMVAGDMAFDPETKIAVAGNVAGLTVNVFSVVPFINIGQIHSQITSILPANQNNYCCVLYSPYSKKMYLRGSGGLNATGVNRYIIVDLSKPLADMVIGYREIDAGSHTQGAGYVNSAACFNGLKINEYYDY